MTGENPYFQINEVDRQFWAERVASDLPAKIFDAHRHICRPEDRGENTQPYNWAEEVARYETFDQAELGYAELFPGRSVSCLGFGFPMPDANLTAQNRYLINGLGSRGWCGLAVTSPTWSAQEVAMWLRQPHIIGIKPYPALVPAGLSGQDISIFDFCRPEHLELLNELGGWLTLHLPRAERLADPDNIAEVIEIRERYPDIVLVVAHLGRAYAGRYIREGLPPLVADEGILFDTSAVQNPAVLAVALDRVGPHRLLFGSDLPIFYMRGRRRWEGDRYINLTSGDYSWNTNRALPQVEATYTVYLYEAIAACLDTCRALGFGQTEIQAVFHDNARRLVDQVLTRKEGW